MKKIITFAFLIIFSINAFAESRNALLIANGKYKTLGSLATPVNEAKDLKKTLEKLGFSVTIVENGSREKMIDSLYDFQKKTESSGGIGFFHYGGHAVQVNGKNYLIPVDADIPDERRVSSRAVDVDEIMTSMQADTNIVILDACRNNPLPASSGRSATRGLVISEYKPKNSIIVYSAQPGKVAMDGVFTPILTEKLLEQKSFNEILMDVRREVRNKTNNEQSPGEYNELDSTIFLASNKEEIKVTKNVVATAPVTRQVAAKTEEKTTFTDEFSSVEVFAALDNIGDDIKAYLKEYQNLTQYTKKIAQKGNAEAQYCLGILCLDYKIDKNGEDDSSDYEKGKNWLLKASEQGHTEAMSRLASYYYNQSNNDAEAIKWYMKASEQGNYKSSNFLGNYYFNRKKYDEAIKWYKKAAEQSDLKSFFSLGECYYNEKKYDEAIKWYLTAAEQGDSNAYYRLGSYYYEKRNYDEAIKWYKKDLETPGSWTKDSSKLYIQSCKLLRGIN